MAAEEVKVLQISTEKSVANVRELRDYIKELKKELADENKTAQQNAKTAEELRAAQAALKDAMYATTRTADEQIAASKALYTENRELTGSYNDLVHELAELKSAWRATADETERAALADEIRRVNDALKDMDERTGSFKRNVGNYTESMKKALREIPSFAQPVKRALDDVNKTMGLMGKQPILSIVALLVPVIQKINAALKDNETAQQAVQRVMQALQPIMEGARLLIEKIAGWLSTATDRVLEWAGQSTDGFKRFVSGAVGVGNAVKEFILTPIRQAVTAVRGLGNVIGDVFKGNWSQLRRDANDAVQGINEAFQRGFDFKGNFAAGKAAGDAFIEGLGAARERAQESAFEVGRDVGTSMAEGIGEGLAEALPELVSVDEVLRQLARGDANREEMRKYWEQQARETGDMLEQQVAETTAAIQEQLDAQLEAEYQALQRERQIADARKRVLETYVYAVSDIMAYLADAIEAESDGSERVANQVKNIRTSSAIIDTAAGAVKAYMAGIATIPVPSWAGIALGIANAATVTAAGLAQIARIRNTQVSKDSSSAAGSSLAPSAGSAVAPSIPQTLQQSTLNDMAYNTQQINRRTADQRVYILQSDLEASGRQVSVRQSESSF